ncbi:retrovirus-related pol polyprotein from transposon TNT 1-94 [Tanacetum coccineum]
MDLCGRMRVQTINGKKYILVIVDDYSRFTWVKFLRSKDKTPEVVIKLLNQIQIGLNKTVRYIRTDNGTKFINQVLTEYYERVDIFHQKSVLRTPQQNGMVERRNRTLVEAARIMLIFSKALMFLWAKAVAIVSDIGISVCYAPSRKGYRIYNKRTRRIMETIHVQFDELSEPMAPVQLKPLRVERPISPAPEVPVPINSTGTPSSTTIDQDAPSPNNPFAPVDKNPFVFAPEPSSEASSSGDVSSAESTHVSQPHHHLGNRARITRLIMSLFQAMQDEIHQFDRLQVWELVPQPDSVMIIALKWIYKVKLDEYGDVLKNKARLLGREILKKFGMDSCDPVDTPMVDRLKLDEDPLRILVYQTRFRSMVGSLMYLTASRPNHVFAVCMCARYQALPTKKHLEALKRVFWYLRETIKWGLWYPKDTAMALTAYADADHVGCQDTRRSTSGCAQFFGDKLVSWSSKKHKSTAISTTRLNTLPCLDVVLRYFECGHSLQAMVLPSIRFPCIVIIVVPLLSAVIMSNTPGPNYQLANIFTKALPRKRFEFLLLRLVIFLLQPDFQFEECMSPKRQLFPADKMADENVPAPAPTRSDDQILPFAAWVPIGKSNHVLDLQKRQKNPIFQIAVDILQNTNFFRAFTASASVPAIYIQQFWNTLTYVEKAGTYRFQLDEDWFTLDANLLREALEITPIDQAHPFVSPPSGDAIMDFVNELGYPEGIITSTDVDFAELMWEEFVQAIQTFLIDKANLGSPTKKGRKDKPHVFPFCRFTKLIICHLGRIHNIHQRSTSLFHLAEEDLRLGNLKFVPKGEEDSLISSMQEAYNRNQEASIQLMQTQIGQMEETFQERPSCVPPSDTETYPREERKASTPLVPPPETPPLSTPKPKEDPKPNPHQKSIPYPSRLQEENFQALENLTGRTDHFVYRIDIVDSLCDKFPTKNNSLSGNPTPSSNFVVESLSPLPIPYEDSDSLVEETDILISHFDDSPPEYETFSFDIEEKSSGSTTTHSDYSLLDYEAFYFNDDHIEEKSSGSTTTYSGFSLPEYDLFIFDLSIDLFPPADRSVSHHEEFVDELAHIISPPEYDYFYFDLEADP